MNRPSAARVQTPGKCARRCRIRKWDIVFSDYFMPGFSAPEAFSIFQQSKKEIPFIIVSGEIGEDMAVESLKLGADDYLLKHNLKRLVPAIHRAMKKTGADRNRAERAEQALAQSEERFRLMVEQVLDYAIFMLDLDGRGGNLECRGRAYQRVPGERGDHRSTVACFFTPEDIAAGKPSALLDQAREQGNTVDEGWRVRKDGSHFWAHTTLTATRDEAGELRGFTKITHDLTERRRAEDGRREIEAQLRQAQKLEAIGQLAAGIAHEINTPTQYVEHNLRFLQDSFTNLKQILDHYQILFLAARTGKVPPELVQEIQRLVAEVDPGPLLGEIPTAIDEAREGTERIAKIVRAMREFSHPGTGKDKPSPTNFNQSHREHHRRRLERMEIRGADGDGIGCGCAASAPVCR